MTENTGPTCASGVPAAAPLDHAFRAGLVLLGQAYTYAQDAGADVWDFALEIDKLYETGLTISDLRWLVTKGNAQHGQEKSAYGDAHRSFRPSDGLNFTNTTCFVLTTKGSKFARDLLEDSAATK